MKLRPRIFVSLIMLVLMAGISGGVFLERAAVLPGSIRYEPAGVAPTFSVFWQTWDLVHEKYVDRTALEPQRLTYGAIEGMLRSLGDLEHTRFLTPEELRREREALQGQLEGIGAELVMRNGTPTILAPIPGSPAQDAGLRPGDVIVRVDGVPVAGLSLDQIIDMVRGPSGSTVTLMVVHVAEATLTDITITRAKLTIPHVTWIILPGTSIAHVLISQFGERATEELIAALNQSREQGAKSIMLDMRNNPGGYRDEGISVASQFLAEGLVLIEQDAEGKRTEFPVKSGGVAVDVPLAILVNVGSASAAEIVAGALQDQQRGKVIGAVTVGTGTVLGTFDLSDGSAVLIGTAEWLTPNGRRIWHRGIEPDIKVELPLDTVPLFPATEAGMTMEEIRASSDNQLLRAMQELSGAH